MFRTETENAFGICQLGEWSAFSHSNIQGYNKRIIDFSVPFPLWLPTLTELSNIFIVSQFASPEDITNALDFIRICRNNLIFISVITPATNKTRSDLTELKNCVDIFLGIEDQYCENEIYTDSVSYAIDFLAYVFDEYIDKRSFKPCYDGPFYAFSQSGSAELVMFQINESDYQRNDVYHLPEGVVDQVQGKRLVYFNIKHNGTCKSWLLGLMMDALKEASGNIYFASGCSIPDKRYGKTMWVTVIVSDMDNPNNSYGCSKNKTAFQGGIAI